MNPRVYSLKFGHAGLVITPDKDLSREGGERLFWGEIFACGVGGLHLYGVSWGKIILLMYGPTGLL